MRSLTGIRRWLGVATVLLLVAVAAAGCGGSNHAAAAFDGRWTLTSVSEHGKVFGASGVRSCLNIADGRTTASDGTNSFNSAVTSSGDGFAMTNVSGTAVGLIGTGPASEVAAAFGSLYQDGSTFTVQRSDETLSVVTRTCELKFRATA